MQSGGSCKGRPTATTPTRLEETWCASNDGRRLCERSLADRKRPNNPCRRSTTPTRLQSGAAHRLNSWPGFHKQKKSGLCSTLSASLHNAWRKPSPTHLAPWDPDSATPRPQATHRRLGSSSELSLALGILWPKPSVKPGGFLADARTRKWHGPSDTLSLQLHMAPGLLNAQRGPKYKAGC